MFEQFNPEARKYLQQQQDNETAKALRGYGKKEEVDSKSLANALREYGKKPQADTMWSGANETLEQSLSAAGGGGDSGLTALTAALSGATKAMSNKKASEYERQRDELIARAAESGNPLAYILAGGDKDFGGKWADNIAQKESQAAQQAHLEQQRKEDWAEKNRQFLAQLEENKRQHGIDTKYKYDALAAQRGAGGGAGNKLSEVQQEQLKWLNSNQKDLTPEQFQKGLDDIEKGSFDIGKFDTRGRIKRTVFGMSKFKENNADTNTAKNPDVAKYGKKYGF